MPNLPIAMTVVPDDLSTLATPPPAVSVVRAMMWNWRIVAISIGVFVAAAVGAALLRTPEYTATSRLAVGRIDINSPGALSGFALATQALATGYSRTVTALAVAKPVSARSGISVKDVQSHVNATPIPESPVFRIEASAPNAGQAIALANLSSRSLIRYTAKLNQDNPDSLRLYAAYRQAVGESNTAERQLKDAAEAQPTTATAGEIASARIAAKASSLRADALGKAYTASVQGQASTQLIQVISPATEATSDRRSTFVIYVFIGFVIGLLVGAGATVLREYRFHGSLAA
jgi:capsular polysaccharide biosynthesis protein